MRRGAKKRFTLPQRSRRRLRMKESGEPGISISLGAPSAGTKESQDDVRRQDIADPAFSDSAILDC